MATARFTAPTGVDIFFESAAGRFDVRIAAGVSQYQTDVMEGGSRAVAVATAAGYSVYQWTNWYNAASGYPDGPLLKTLGGSTNANRPANPSYSSQGPYITVVDDHGTHHGTPVCIRQRIVYGGEQAAKGAAAVQHATTDDGWLFQGWRITRAPRYATDSMDYVQLLTSGGVDDGPVTTFSADALDGSAVVAVIPRSSGAYYDTLTIEAIYIEAPTECTLSYSKNAEDATGPSIPDTTVPFDSFVTLANPAYWKRPGYAIVGWCERADGSGTIYPANSTWAPAAAQYWVTMYAVWSKVGGDGIHDNYHESLPSQGYYVTMRWTDPYQIGLSVSGLVGGAKCVITFRDRAVGSYRYLRYINAGEFNAGYVYEDITTPAGATALRTATLPGTISYPESGYISYSRVNTRYSTNPTQTTEEYRYNFRGNDWEWIAPEMPGMEFVGWYTIDATYSGTPAEKIYSVLMTADRETTWGVIAATVNNIDTSASLATAMIRLVYRGAQYRVVCQPNGGIVADPIIYVRYTGTYGTLPTPTRMGYTFTGWYTERTGGSRVTAATVVTTAANHQIYAHWSETPVQVSVSFVGNGGTCATASKTVMTQGAYGTLPTPTRTGYTFTGWYTASGGGSLITADTVVVIGYDHQLYAQWAGEPLTITFDATGGTVTPASKVVARGDYYGWLPVPTRTGYAFAGWYTAADGGSMISGMPTGDTTIYAHWAEPLPDGGSAAMISQYTSP